MTNSPTINRSTDFNAIVFEGKRAAWRVFRDVTRNDISAKGYARSAPEKPMAEQGAAEFIGSK